MNLGKKKFGSFLCVLLALLLCVPLCAMAQEAEPSDEAVQWYELSAEDGVLTVRLPLGDVQKESWQFIVGNERVIELLTCEVIGDEAEEGTDGAMWVGSFKSFSAEEGRTVIQFTRTDESGAVVEARMLHIAAAEDTSLSVVNAVENSFYYLNAERNTLNVSLAGNSTTGYSWGYAVSDADILTCTAEEYIAHPSEGMEGVGGTYTARFEGSFEKTGIVTLVLAYARPWEGNAIEQHQIRLFVNEANEMELLCDEPAPAFTPKKAKPAPQPAAPVAEGGTVFDAVLQSKGFQQLLQTAVLDALHSPQGQDLLTQAIRKELAKLK